MVAPEYHHSQRTRFTHEEVEQAVGHRASITLEGKIVQCGHSDAGHYVVLEVDERYGFGPFVCQHYGGDMELFDLLEE